MKSKNHYSEEDLEENLERVEEKSENFEEDTEKQGRFNFDKIRGFLGMLKLQGSKISYILVNFLFVAIKKIFRLLKKIWGKEVDVYKIYYVYRNLVIKSTNKYYKNFLNTKDIEEQEKLKEEAKEYGSDESNVPKIPLHYKIRFAFNSLIYDVKYLIIFLILNFIVFLNLYITNDLEGTELFTLILIFIFNYTETLLFTVGGFMLLIYFIEVKNVQNLVENSTEYYDDIWIIANRGYVEIEKELNKSKINGKDEADKQLQSSKKQSAVSNQSTVQQQPRQEEVYNPYSKMWREINTKYFKLEDFTVPSYEVKEYLESHTLKNHDLKEQDVIKIRENIEKYRGKPIHSILSDGGKIIVDFLIGEFPDKLSFYDVPKINERDSIYVGKSAEGWISWNLKTAPHAFITATTGIGKSNTVRFILNEVQKKEWLPIMVDLKGGADYFSIEDKYKLIVNRQGFADYCKKLYGELLYRQRLFKECRTNDLEKVNKVLKSKGEKPIPRMVLFVDEFASINAVDDDCTKPINDTIGQLLQLGRSFAMNVVIIVQRADSTSIGNGTSRGLIGFRMIGKQEDDSGYGMGHGTGTKVSQNDKLFVDKIRNDAKPIGKFIIKGGSVNGENLGRNVIVRVPHMNEEDFQDMVLNEWEDNPYADYKLHYEEGNEVEEKETAAKEFSDYEIVKEDIVINDDKKSSAENSDINLWDYM